MTQPITLQIRVAIEGLHGQAIHRFTTSIEMPFAPFVGMTLVVGEGENAFTFTITQEAIDKGTQVLFWNAANQRLIFVQDFYVDETHRNINAFREELRKAGLVEVLVYEKEPFW